NYEDCFTHRLYEGMVSGYVMVEYLISISPRLRKSYDLVNRLKWALKNRRFDRFEEVLNKAREETYPQNIRTVLNTLEKYIEAIESTFIYNLSNGPIDGINNKIKNIKSSEYGYSNFNNLNQHILISCILFNH